jgi:hypothetical protein
MGPASLEGGRRDASTSRAQASAAASPAEIAARAYWREFSEAIPRPAIYTAAAGGRCEQAQVVTTAYLRTSPTTARLLYLSLDEDGAVRRRITTPAAQVPAGTFRVLAVVVEHSETAPRSDIAKWEAAQDMINRDHASFASSRGLARPIVVLDNTTLTVAAGEIADPRNVRDVRHALQRKRMATDSFQFIVVVNIDPLRSEGGFAGLADGFVYMGNYSRWRQPLTAAEWINVANAVYHHEVSHHWGWDHGWVRQCGSDSPAPFIAPPILFGWEDVDGDRIPEILDDTPYGR